MATVALGVFRAKRDAEDFRNPCFGVYSPGLEPSELPDETTGDFLLKGDFLLNTREKGSENAKGMVRDTEEFCPRYHRAVEIVGRRWSRAILRAMPVGATRFGQIEDAIPGLSNRMLSERLKEFEAEGIVERMVIPEKPVRVEYRLTENGRALHPAVEALSE
jgi:DNA-binding HxlR family transcriptional regulator